MKYIEWNEEKNKKLIEEREVSFEDVLGALENGSLWDILEHRNKKKYPNQKIMIVEIQNYIYLVPYIEDEQKIFLKTIIPSRKATKKYLFKNGGKK